MTSRSSYLDELKNRSPGPCYNLLETPSSAAAVREAYRIERQNEFIRKGIERETRLRMAADVRTKEEEVHAKQIMEKVENDKVKIRRKLAQQESKAKLVHKQNEAKQQRVMQHKQKEAACFSSGKEKQVREEKNREEIARRRKDQHEALRLIKCTQWEKKLQEAADQRSRERELLEKRMADKQAAEEHKMRRRLEAARAVREALQGEGNMTGRSRSSQESPGRIGFADNSSRRQQQNLNRSTLDLAQSVDQNGVETQQIELLIPTYPTSAREYSPFLGQTSTVLQTSFLQNQDNLDADVVKQPSLTVAEGQCIEPQLLAIQGSIRETSGFVSYAQFGSGVQTKRPASASTHGLIVPSSSR